MVAFGATWKCRLGDLGVAAFATRQVLPAPGNLRVAPDMAGASGPHQAVGEQCEASGRPALGGFWYDLGTSLSTVAQGSDPRSA